MKRFSYQILVVLLLGVGLGACVTPSGTVSTVPSESTAAPAPQSTSAPPSATTPIPTPSPTSTPAPALTAAPTRTLSPSPTAILTVTAKATDSTEPLAATSEPTAEPTIGVFVDLVPVAQLGEQLFLLDQAASRGTDVMLASVENAATLGIRGWIVMQDGNEITVTFTGQAEGKPVSLVDVHYSGAGLTNPELKLNYPPRPLSSPEQAMQAARVAALRGFEPLCDPPYNTIVVSDTAKGEYLVYLIAATTDPDALVAAGHALARVSASGELLERRNLSHTCLVVENPKDLEAVLITELISEQPTEIHVFLSLLHDKPIIVITGQNEAWGVSGTAIVKVNL